MSSSGEVSPASVTPATTPSLQATHAPKYGQVIRNRIFVGGIAANTTAQELKVFFSNYGTVQESKIITDRGGISKGYGFITFETLEDAERIIKKEADNLVFKDRKLNIGPAIKKQDFQRVYEPSVSPGAVMFSNGVPYTYHNGMAVFHPQEGAYHVPAQPQVTPPTPTYPMMVPSQAVYVSQPGYAYQSPMAAPAAQWSAAQNQWRWTAAAQQSPTASYLAYPAMPAMTPEMYAQAQSAAGHAAATYQPTDIADASMMEAAPAEGSMVMDPTLRQAYAEPNAGSAILHQAPPPSALSAVNMSSITSTPSGEVHPHIVHHHQQQHHVHQPQPQPPQPPQPQQQQQQPQQQQSAAPPPTTTLPHHHHNHHHHHLLPATAPPAPPPPPQLLPPPSGPAAAAAPQTAAAMAAPATTVLPVHHHRTPVAYKRPLTSSSSRKLVGTPTVSLSPRATPPSKVLITHQRIISQMGPPPSAGPGDLHEVAAAVGLQQVQQQPPLTPPATPEVVNHA